MKANASILASEMSLSSQIQANHEFLNAFVAILVRFNPAQYGFHLLNQGSAGSQVHSVW